MNRKTGQRLVGAVQSGLERRQQVDHQRHGLRLADDTGGEPLFRGGQIQRHVFVEQPQRQPRLAREGPRHVARPDRTAGAGGRFVRSVPGRPGRTAGPIPPQILQKPDRPGWVRRVGGEPPMQPVDLRHRLGGQRHRRRATGPGDVVEGLPARFGRWLLDPNLLECPQQGHVLAFDQRDLLRRTLGDCQQFAASQRRPQERAQALLLAFAPADLHQLQQWAEVQHDPLPGHLAAQFFTALLPHAESGHAGHQARPAGAPEGPQAQAEIRAAPHQFAHQRRLADARRPHQQRTARRAAAKHVGQSPQVVLALERLRLPESGQRFGDFAQDRTVPLLRAKFLPSLLLGAQHEVFERLRCDLQIPAASRLDKPPQRRRGLGPEQRGPHLLVHQARQVGGAIGEHLDLQPRHIGDEGVRGLLPLDGRESEGHRFTPGRRAFRRFEHQFDVPTLDIARQDAPRQFDVGHLGQQLQYILGDPRSHVPRFGRQATDLRKAQGLAQPAVRPFLELLRHHLDANGDLGHETRT